MPVKCLLYKYQGRKSLKNWRCKRQNIYQEIHEMFIRYLEDFRKESNNMMVNATSCDSGIP